MAERRGRSGHHGGRIMGPGAFQDRITHSLRRRNKSEDSEQSAINPFVKYFLFGINFLFMVVRVVFFALMYSNSLLVCHQEADALQMLEILVGLALAATSIYILSQKDKSVTSFVDFIFDPACDLCLAGCIVLAIAFFGCAGALRESTRLLCIYHTVLVIFLILEIILIIFVFVFYFVDGAFANIGLYPEDAFKDAIRKYRDDQDMQGFIDNIQKLFSCCGTTNDNDGYLDWNKNPYFNCTNKNDSPEACSVPFSCCKITQGENVNYRCGAGALKASSNRTQIHVEGCLKGLQNVITNNVWIVGGVILAIIIPQLFFICLAKALASQIFEQMSKW